MATQKPLPLLINDTKKSIIDFTNALIKDSKLPICLVEPMFKEVYTDIVNASKNEYDIASKQYIEALGKENDVNDTKKPVDKTTEILRGEIE